MFQVFAKRIDITVGEVRDMTIGTSMLRALVIISEEIRPLLIRTRSRVGDPRR